MVSGVVERSIYVQETLSVTQNMMWESCKKEDRRSDCLKEEEMEESMH